MEEGEAGNVEEQQETWGVGDVSREEKRCGQNEGRMLVGEDGITELAEGNQVKQLTQGRNHIVGRFGTPRKSSDTTRRTASGLRPA